jgi:DNA-binding PadR family transcriptional regulator
MFWLGRGLGRGLFRNILERKVSPVEFLILVLLQEKPMAGSDIINDLKAKFGGAWEPKSGTIYPTLSRLENDQLIKNISDTEESGTKKVYTLTDKGKEILQIIAERFDREIDLLGKFVNFIDEYFSPYQEYVENRLKDVLQFMEDRGKQLREWVLQIVQPEHLQEVLHKYRSMLERELAAVNETLNNQEENPSKSFQIEVDD